MKKRLLVMLVLLVVLLAPVPASAKGGKHGNANPDPGSPPGWAQPTG
jgi:hypothetical protein